MTVPLILLLFPDGALPSRRWRSVVWLVVACGAADVLQAARSPGPFTDEMPGLVNPTSVDWTALDVIGVLSHAGFAVGLVAAVVSLLVRLRRADPVLRQ